jgi:hypothetical protein
MSHDYAEEITRDGALFDEAFLAVDAKLPKVDRCTRVPQALPIIILTLAMSTTVDLLKDAQSSASTNPQRAEHLYKQILTNTAGQIAGALHFRSLESDMFLCSINIQ